MDPLKLLERDETRIEPFLSKHWLPFTCSAAGFITACFINFGTRRPVFSGLQKHVVGVTTGWMLGTYAENYREQYFAEKDAVLRHYISLHPEDFPTPERKKFGELLQMWIPVR